MTDLPPVRFRANHTAEIELTGMIAGLPAADRDAAYAALAERVEAAGLVMPPDLTVEAREPGTVRVSVQVGQTISESPTLDIRS